MSWDLATAKRKLGIDAEDTSKDAQITVVMGTTLTSIETMLQRNLLYAADIEEKFFREHAVTLVLSRFPLTEIVSVDGGDMDNNWLVDLNTGVIHLPAYRYFDELSIIYSGGYPTDALPADLERAMWEAFLYLWGVTDSETGAATGAGTGTDLASGTGEVSRVTIQDFGSVTLDAARSVSGDAALAMSDRVLDWGWLHPWASTLQMHRSQHGVGLGAA